MPGAAKVYVTARKPDPAGDPRITPLEIELTEPGAAAKLAQPQMTSPSSSIMPASRLSDRS
jgi:hypothetical protein